jgi:hypothetical protein
MEAAGGHTGTSRRPTPPSLPNGPHVAPICPETPVCPFFTVTHWFVHVSLSLLFKMFDLGPYSFWKYSFVQKQLPLSPHSEKFDVCARRYFQFSIKKLYRVY